MKSSFILVMSLFLLPLALISTANAYVTLCQSGCNFTSFDSALAYLNNTQDTLVINGSGTYTLASSGSYYVNASSSGSTDSAGAAISITADNVVVDCNKSVFVGNNSDKGFYSGIALKINSTLNVTVRNCIFQNYTYGVFVRNSNSTSLINITSSYNRYGALDFTSSSATIINSSFSYNRYALDVYGFGSSFDASTSVLVQSSVASFSSVDGITVKYASLTLRDVSAHSNGALSGDSGIVAFSSNITLYNLTLHSNTDTALSVESGTTMDASRITIYNQSYGIATYDNVSADISYLTAYNTSFIIYDSRNSSITLRSSTLNDSSSTATFTLDDDSVLPSTIRVINTSYNLSKVSFGDSSSKLFMGWLVAVLVNDSSGPLANASVTATASNGSIYLSSLTNSSGMLAPLWNPVPVLVQTSSYNRSLNNYSISIFKNGYVRNISSLNITSNVWLNFTLKAQTGILPNVSSFGGNTTDFTLEPDLTNVSGAVLETPYGRVTFLGGNNFSGADLDAGLTISFGLVGLNSTGLPTLNVSARIALYNVSCQVSTLYYYPQYTRNRTLVLSSGSDCESAGICSSRSCSNGTLEFNVSHFSSFAVHDYANVTAWDDSDSSSVYVYRNITFYANYTTGSGIVDGGTGLSFCYISFNSSPGSSSWSAPNNMSFSSSSGLYTYSTYFTSPGTVWYNISCNGTLLNASPSSAVENATILNDTTAPVLTINSPANGTTLAYTTSSVTVNISTDETAECRYSSSSSSDFSSATDFQNTNATQHTFAASVSNGTNYTFYYLCRDLNGNVNSPAAEHFFSVAAAPSGPSISISHPSNGSTLAVGTTWTWLNITTNESASCKFSSNSSFSFASEGTLMSSNSSNTGHYYNYSSLSNGQTYTIYYRCNNSMAAVSSPKKHVFSVAPDTSSPSISFISPTPSSGSTSTSSSVNIKVNISETANATLVFNGNSYVMKNSTGGTQGTTLNKTLSVSDGTYSYYVVAEDSAGNTATSSTRTLTIDTTAPVITFVSPSNGSTLSDGGNILLSVSTDEAANCTLTSRKLGTTTSTSDVVLTANSARTSFTKRFNSTADSSGFDNYFTVQCVDDYSHTSTSTTYFKINDTTAPSVTFVSPKSNSYVASSSVTLNITTSEPLGSVKKAKVDSGSYVSLSGSSYYYYTFTSLNDSKHTITVNVSDTKGNTASYSVSFTVDTQSPELEVVSPENKEKISDCTAVVFNLSLSEESECSYEWFEDVEDECRDDCQADYDECYNDSDTVDEKNACRDDRDACYDDCEEEKYESIDDDSLEEQDRDACYSCQDSCEESCDSDYDSCMDSADTSDEEDSCKDDYDSCVSDCDDSCEDECKWYYYASFSQCVDDGDYLVAFSCEDNAGNENKTNITFSVEDTVPPVILSLSPSGKVYSYSVTLSATTSEDAECRYSDSNEGFSSMKNSMSGSGTSHSASLSFSEPGEHTYYVSCNDTNGNVMSSANSTTFEVVPTENDYAYKKLGRLSAGEIPVSFDNSSDVPVRKVVLKLSAEVDSEIIEVEELPAKPDDVPAPSKKVYSYLDLRRKSPSSALESAEITFDVSTSWIVSEGISASDIVLKHFVDSSSSWEDLPTSKVSESAEFITYTAKTPSFSIFAISVKESEKSQASSSQSSSQDSKASAGTSDEGSANETPENETVLQPDLDQPLPEWPEMPSSGFSWLWTLVSVLGLVAAGGAVWVTFKGPFWKQPGSGGSGGSGAHSESTMPSSESSESRSSLSEEEEAISSYLASGMTLEQVRDLFVGNGWSPEDFDSLYASYFAKVSSSESSSESSSVGSSPESSQDSYSESLPDSSPEASPAASEPGSEPVSEPAPDLGAFIKQSIRAGLDTHDIVRQLLDAGWPKDAVLSEIRFLEEQKLSLEKFAEQQIQSGIPKEEIKNMLLSQGWPEEDIDDALKKF